MPYVPGPKTNGKADDRSVMDPYIADLAKAIAMTAARHGYEGAFAGEMNYALTRILNELPRQLMAHGVIKEEIRYWIQPTMYGVLLDVALEHKRRVNVAYEADQIVKSGDCYDTPYYTRLVEVVDQNGKVVGHQEVMLKRSPDTLNKDIVGEIQIKVK